MSDCDVMRESMPLLLTESLDPARRELAHQHIERCASCSDEWTGYRETWGVLADLPEVEVPSAVKERFLSSVGEASQPQVVPFRRPRYVRWFAEAAAVVLVAGASYYAGHRTVPMQTPAKVNSVAMAPFSIAESRVLPANAISPNIEGRPDIQNVSFHDENPNDAETGVS